MRSAPLIWIGTALALISSTAAAQDPLSLAEQAYLEVDFPETERQSRHILTLPVDQHLTEVQVERVVDVVKAFFHG